MITTLNAYEKLVAERIATALICGASYEAPQGPAAGRILIRAARITCKAERLATRHTDEFLRTFAAIEAVASVSKELR